MNAATSLHSNQLALAHPAPVRTPHDTPPSRQLEPHTHRPRCLAAPRPTSVSAQMSSPSVRSTMSTRRLRLPPTSAADIALQEREKEVAISFHEKVFSRPPLLPIRRMQCLCSSAVCCCALYNAHTKWGWGPGAVPVVAAEAEAAEVQSGWAR